jgi:uncharacterized RDD family membrane protein YckC
MSKRGRRHRDPAPVVTAPDRRPSFSRRGVALAVDAIALGLIASACIGIARGASYLIVGSVTAGEVVLGLAGPPVLLVGYFAAFWATIGSTPGLRLAGLWITSTTGDSLRPLQAWLRALVIYGPIGLTLGLPPRPFALLGVGWVAVIVLLELRGLGPGDRLASTRVAVARAPLPTVERIPRWGLVALGILLALAFVGGIAGGLAATDAGDASAGALGALAAAVFSADLVFLLTYWIYRGTSWAETVPAPREVSPTRRRR